MTSSFTPSPLQQSIGDCISDPAGGSLSVHAVAGSGKTTTCVWATSLIPQRKPGEVLSQSILFLAFNKNIAETLKSRLPSHVSAATFHAHGMRALRPLAPKASRDWVQGNKVSKMVYREMDRQDPDLLGVIRLVSLMKTTWPVVSAKEHILRHDIDFVDERTAMQVAQHVFDLSIKNLDSIDFDDMLFLPVYHSCTFSEQDWVFVDEAQDTNGIQLEILLRMQHSATRYCVVGDPHQAIYGFRGANSDAMEIMEQKLSCHRFPLDVSYRCPKAVVREAQKYMQKESSRSDEQPFHALLSEEEEYCEQQEILRNQPSF